MEDLVALSEKSDEDLSSQYVFDPLKITIRELENIQNINDEILKTQSRTWLEYPELTKSKRRSIRKTVLNRGYKCSWKGNILCIEFFANKCLKEDFKNEEQSDPWKSQRKRKRKRNLHHYDQ